jgi:murein DD-endopeptidase MepM/ murein hydrolase activator NlpD
MQMEIRKVVNDFQSSIQEMGFIEVYESSDENERVINNNTGLNATLVLDAVNAAESLPDIYPVSSEARLTSGYGNRIDPFTGKRAFHEGIDLAVPENTEVVSCGTGRIEKAGYNRTNGNYIIIDHDNKYKSYYGHLSRVNVKKGDEVEKGQVIGLSGNTGMSTGPHIHFQISFGGKTINPLSIIK